MRANIIRKSQNLSYFLNVSFMPNPRNYFLAYEKYREIERHTLKKQTKLELELVLKNFLQNLA